jgi:hypothetical protein
MRLLRGSLAPCITILGLLGCGPAPEPVAAPDEGSGDLGDTDGTTTPPTSSTDETSADATTDPEPTAADPSSTGPEPDSGTAARCVAPKLPSVVGLSHDGEYNYAASFPIEVSFDDDAYATEYGLPWVTTEIGAMHEFVADGGWDGCGAARFFPPTSGEGMSGIGQILGLRQVVDSPTLAMRYCIAAGATFPELSSGAKPTILWRADPATDVQGHDDAVGARPMVISRPDPEGRGITYGLCDGTVCTYVGGDFWPDGSDTWVLEGDGAWTCIELDFDLQGDSMQMYVTTQDGRFDDTLYLEAVFRDEASGPGGVFAAIDIIGGYFAMSTADPDNWYEIDDLVIDTAHIGPPPGFAR